MRKRRKKGGKNGWRESAFERPAFISLEMLKLANDLEGGMEESDGETESKGGGGGERKRVIINTMICV